MLSSNVFKDLQGNVIDNETAVSMPAGSVTLEKRNKEVERYSNDFLLSSARIEAACLIILDRKYKHQPVTEKDFTSFRSTLKEYLLLKDEILKKEVATNTYIIRDDSYTIMTMYRVAYLVRKACKCNTIWYGKKTKLACFEDYNFSISLLTDEKLFSKLEKKLMNSFAMDPKSVLKLATLRTMIKNIPAMITGKVVYLP